MMVGTWHIGMDNPLVIAGVLLLLASFAFTLRLVRGRGISRRRFWIVASLNAIAYGTVVLLLLDPKSPVEHTRAVTLLTDTPIATEFDTPIYLAPGITKMDGLEATPLYALGQLPLKESGLGRLKISGHGLSETDWKALPAGVPIEWTAPTITGTYDARWPRTVMVGESWHITGKYKAAQDTNPDAIFTVELIDPAGNIVASKRLKSDQAFTLKARTKTAGPLLYRLKVTDRKGDTLSTETVPVFATRPKPTKLMVVQSAPSFEARHMLEWAARFGADLTVQTQISKDRYLSQSSKPEEANQLSPFAPETLAAQDMLVIDGRSLTTLDAVSRAALEEAVHAGLGVLIVADSDLIKSIDDMQGALLAGFELKEVSAQNQSAAPRWPAAATEMPLPVLPFEIIQKAGTPLVISETGRVLNLMQTKGLGRVALSLLRQRHAWATSGDTALYAAYWSYIMAELARPSVYDRIVPPAENKIARVADKTTVCALGTNPNLKLEIKGTGAAHTFSRTAQLVPEQAGSPRSCAAYYPQTSGWYEVRLFLENESTPLDNAYIYAHARKDWAAVDAQERQAATAIRMERTSNQEAPPTSTQMGKAIPPFWLWLTLVITAALLWIERKLD